MYVYCLIYNTLSTFFEISMFEFKNYKNKIYHDFNKR